MKLPVNTLDFWLVTALFLGAAWYLLRGLWPLSLLSGPRRQARRETRATLTVGGRVVDKGTKGSST